MKAFTTVAVIAIVTLADAIKGREMRTTVHAINKHAAKRKAHAKAKAAAAQGAIETAKIDEDKKDIIASTMTEGKDETESATMTATHKESRHVTLDINEDKKDVAAALIMKEQSLSGDVQKPSGNSVLEEAGAFKDEASRPRRPISIMLVSTAPEGISQLTEPSHWVRSADADGGYDKAKKQTAEMRKAVVTKDHLGRIRQFPVPWLKKWSSTKKTREEQESYSDFLRSKTEVLAMEPLLVIDFLEKDTHTSKKLQRQAADDKIKKVMMVNGRSTYYSALGDGLSYPVGQHDPLHTDASYYYGPFQSAEKLLEALKDDEMLTSVYENLKLDDDDWSVTGLGDALEVLDQFRIDYEVSNLYLQIDWVGWRVRPVLEFVGEEADVKQKFQHLFDAAVEAMAERVRLGRLA